MGVWKDGIQSWNAVKIFGSPNKANPLPYERWSAWRHEPTTPKGQLGDCKVQWKYNRPDLLQRLRDIKDNLKYLPKGQKPTITPKKIREEFTWYSTGISGRSSSIPWRTAFRSNRCPTTNGPIPTANPCGCPGWTRRPNGRSLCLIRINGRSDLLCPVGTIGKGRRSRGDLNPYGMRQRTRRPFGPGSFFQEIFC